MDSSGFRSESADDYASRIGTVLPHWPKEVLIEWFWRHFNDIGDYAFLDFSSFRFSRQEWQLERIPGREAFRDPRFYDNFSDIEQRAKYPYDWLARYMMEHGTWNTPVILLANSRELTGGPNCWTIRAPNHLLEGHRRLSFLGGLRQLGKACPKHEVWIVERTDSMNHL